MLELVNKSDWEAALQLGWSLERKRQFTLAVKIGYRFAVDGTLEPLAETPELVRADAYHGERIAAACPPPAKWCPSRPAPSFS
ncbi:hypothetical protein [Alkalilimnicola ehrlichii]|uniref:Uncharacterized protein n=1 Tax=Alkalilimnicola ehrlichii TaxID=351052 RepID=A0A3E0WTY2_9GAMM|nr:hypothetical protein [Alkalilimnicola ehrlichii]RFA36452.1 hypothetical protein CAL65_10765 [Alkalilimnicola ehrlichii]